KGPQDVLELVKKDDGWHLSKPAEERADDQAVQGLVARLAGLRARRIADYPARDLGKYGLDKPQAVVQIKLAAEGKPAMHVIKLGKSAGPEGGRFAQVDGRPAVAVLPGGLAGELEAGPLGFRDRTLARFADADRIRLEQGPRRAVFGKVEGTWKLV